MTKHRFRKAELVQLLLMHDKEEAKMGAKTGDTVEELRKENARLRKENLFLQVLSSDGFEKVSEHLTGNMLQDRNLPLPYGWLDPEYFWDQLTTVSAVLTMVGR